MDRASGLPVLQLPHNPCVLDAFKQHVEQRGFWGAEDQVLVGYSGGADSTCLLHMMRELGTNVVAAHLHHGQRQEADDELDHCAAFCEQLRVPFVSGHADVPRLSEDRKIGLEEAGRVARYAFFEDAASQTGCTLIATAHTRDDFLETVLYNIARGTGLAGLAGIPERRGNIVRPLLPFLRSETRRYCEERNFWTHDDPSNSDNSFARARIRHRIVPEFLHLNADVHSAIERLARIASEEETFLNGVAARALETCSIPLNGHFEFLTLDCEVALTKSKLLALPHTLLRRALKLVVSVLEGEVTLDSVEDLVALIEHQHNGSWTAKTGTPVCTWHDDMIHFESAEMRPAARTALSAPGTATCQEGNWRIECLLADVRITTEPLEATLEPSAIRGGLHVRPAKSDDRWQPLGLTGTKRIYDSIADLKLTPAAKKRLPVVFDMVGPIWVPGKGIAERVKLTSESKSCVHLKLDCLTPTCEP